MGFNSQLRTLLKKNLLLKSKSKCGIFCEIVLGIVIVLIIFAILILVNAFKPNYEELNATQFYFRINNNSRLIYGSEQGTLSTDQQGVISVMKLQVSTFQNKTETQVEPYFIEINDQLAMEAYFLNNSKHVIAGIWFDTTNSSTSSSPPGPSFTYNIRLDSNRVENNDLKKEKSLNSEVYLTKNFGFTQIAMDQAIFSYYGLNSLLSISGGLMPDPYIEQWQKWINGREAIFKSAGSVFVTAALMIFGFRLVTDLVVEKETKIREGMKMMGLNDLAYFTSWIITSSTIGIPVDLIIILILKGSQVIHTTSWGIVIVTLISYLITLLLLSVILSMFFDKSKFSGLLSFLIVLLVNICGIFVGETEFNTSVKLLLCLFSPIAIANSFYAMSARDLTDIRTVNWDYTLTESQVIGMLVLDVVFYSFLIFYLDKVVPSEFGVKQPWYFLVTKKYWNSNKPIRGDGNNHGADEEGIVSGFDNGGLENNQDVELTPIEVRSNVAISIRNLRKEFNTGDGLRVAVNDLNLDIYQGSIHGLLGNNGSGKTTIVSLLSGLIVPTSGTAYLNGNDIRWQMSNIRKVCGVCPQQDIIWPQLTVLEHLKIYASLKGLTNSKDISNQAKKMCLEIGLSDKTHTPAGSLSGGQKRKLCLGISFIGDSKIIFLDEVTSGVDPLSRLSIWDFILKNKQGKTIIIISHHLDEIEHLSNRIAIISHGSLICDGSNMFLKNKYGVGYLLTCSKVLSQVENFNPQQILEFVNHHIPDANILSDAGGEISFRLPNSSIGSFTEFFTEFDQRLEQFNICSYGISVTTLEEVFIRIGQESHKQFKLKNNIQEDPNDITVEGQKQLKEAIAITSEGISSKQQLKGLLIKRILTSAKDKKSFLLAFLLPLIVIIGSIIVYKKVNNATIFYNNVTTPLIMNESQYGLNDQIPIQTLSNVDFEMFNSSPYFSQFVYRATDSVPLFNDYLVGNYKLSTGAIRFDSPIVFGNQSFIEYTALYNFGYIHSWPIHVNTINDALLRKHIGIGIQVTSMPFKHVLSNFDIASQDMNIQAIVYFIIIIMAGYSLMAGTFAGNIAQERTNRIKRLLYISGCKKYIYWISNLIWDYVFALILLLVTCIVLGIVDDKFGDQFGLFILSLILFCIAIVPLSYLLSYKFASFGKATGAITAIHFAIGVVFTIVMINLRIQVIIKKSASLELISDKIDILFDILSPLYAFSKVLFILTGFPGSIRLSDLGKDINHLYWTLDYGATPLIILAVHAIVWVTWILLLDYKSTFVGFLINPKTVAPPEIPADEDADVTAERTRVASLSPSDEPLQWKGLHKQFKGSGKNPTKNAVLNSTISIPRGTCFGLLGLNGAGKTTTLQMVVGDLVPTSGQVTINGFDLITQRSKALHSIGYCFQFDALITLLSARQQLTLYCRIKGVPENKISMVVEAFIKIMSLDLIANSNTGGYSGGNKRKTSLSISMLGNPSIVLLDEPSTGVDVFTKKHMWNVISELGKDKVIVLTTHALSEVEALANRITIMKDGKLMCLGSIQWVKSRYGSGYSFQVKFKKECLEDGVSTVLKYLPTASILDQHDLMASFELPNPPDSPIKVSSIFSILSNELSYILDDYNVSQTSLEHVFLKLTGASNKNNI